MGVLACSASLTLGSPWAGQGLKGPDKCGAFAQHLLGGTLVPGRPWDPVLPRTEAKAERA